MDKIVSDMGPLLKSQGIIESRDNCVAQFVLRVRDNLHIVLGMSPVGDALRIRARDFPSLVNCSTIDWFHPWPEDALVKVAESLLAPLEGLPSDATKAALVRTCGAVHQSVEGMGEKFWNELRRKTYTTPKSYLDLIGLYLEKLGNLQGECDVKSDRMKIGVAKLEETNAIVSSLEQELVALAPELESKGKAAEELLIVVGREKADADVVKERVSADEAVAKAQASDVKAVADDAQADLDKAMPALKGALKALDSLTKGDITEVKSFPKPPPAVEVVMQGVCIMLGQKPDWETAKKVVLADGNFLEKLKKVSNKKKTTPRRRPLTHPPPN